MRKSSLWPLARSPKDKLRGNRGFQKFVVVFKYVLCKIENAERDEERGKDVDGIMQMAEEYGGSADRRAREEKISQILFVPKNEREHKRQAGMRRKEEIV